ARKVPMRQRGAVEIGRLSLGEVLHVYILEVAQHEILDDRALRLPDLGADDSKDVVEAAAASDIAIRAHRSSSIHRLAALRIVGCEWQPRAGLASGFSFERPLILQPEVLRAREAKQSPMSVARPARIGLAGYSAVS